MALMNQYYEGPAPWAAAAQSFTESFLRTYKAAKDMSMSKERLEMEKAEQKEMARHRQQMENFQAQQLGMQEAQVEQTRAQTAAVLEAQARGRKAREVLGQYTEANAPQPEAFEPDFYNPYEPKSQTQMLREQATLLDTIDPELAMKYRGAAAQSEQLELSRKNYEATGRLQAAQTEVQQQQAIQMKDLQAQLEKERAGFKAFALKNAPEISKTTGIVLSPDTPIPIIKYALDIFGEVLKVKANPAYRDQALAIVSTEMSRLQTDLTNILRTDMTMMPEPQKAALIERGNNLRQQIDMLGKAQIAMFEGSGRTTAAGLLKPPAPAPKQQAPTSQFTVGPTPQAAPPAMGGGVQNQGMRGFIAPFLGLVGSRRQQIRPEDLRRLPGMGG